MTRRPRVDLWIAAAIAAGTLLVYGQAVGFPFLTHDDPDYVTDNARVLSGLSADGLRWAFTTGHAANWHPLTWLSHMLDVSLFGPGPTGPHAVNVFLHVANALLLFAVLRWMTGRRWPPALAAALFALHPLHVESVAWVSERKDLLSTAFGLLAVWAYADWARNGGARRYATTGLLLAAGLASKPMLVTLPVVFLLLDHWPLGRPIVVRRVVEKLPLLALSAASSAVTIAVQRSGGAMPTVEEVAPALRVANAIVSCARYLGKTVWPSNLSLLYPHPNLLGGTPWSAWQVLVAAAVLAVVSALALRARNRPYLVVGWLWYLVTLLPVLGLIQVGPQAMADRYTYLPLIGPFVAVAWGLGDVLAATRSATERRAWIAGALLVPVALGSAAWRQTRYWRDSVTLFERSVRLAPDSPVLRLWFSKALRRAGRDDEAIAELERAVRTAPGYATARLELATLYWNRGMDGPAEEHLAAAARLDSGSAEAWNDLGNALLKRNRSAEAVAPFERALAADPRLVDARYNLALAFQTSGRVDEAIAQYERVLRANPAHAQARNNLAHALRAEGRFAEALEQFRAAAALVPDWAGPVHGQARILAVAPDPAVRDPAAAVRLAARACELTGNRNAEALDTLAAAHAAAGDFERAVGTAERALALAGSNPAAAAIREHLALYRTGRAFVEDSAGE